MDEKKKEFIKFLKKDRSYSSKQINNIHTQNLYKKTETLSFKNTADLSYTYPASFLIGNKSISPDKFIKAINPKNTETIYLALNAAYALNREDIIFTILHRYKHMEKLFYCECNPCLLCTALKHSSRTVVKGLFLRMKSYNLITPYIVSICLSSCLLRGNISRFNWLLKESGFSLDDLMIVSNGSLFIDTCSLRRISNLKDIFNQLDNCDHLFSKSIYRCFINIFWNKNIICREYLVNKGFNVIRKSISLGNYSIIHLSSEKKYNSLIEKILNLYPNKAKEIISSKDFYIVQRAILTDNIELLLIILHHHKKLLDDLLKRDPSQFEFGLHLNCKLKTLIFLESLKPKVVCDLFVIDQYKSIYHFIKMNEHYHVQRIITRFNISVEELIKANNYEILIHIALSNGRRLIDFLNSRLCYKKKYIETTLHINFKKLVYLSYLYPPSALIKFLRRFPIWTRRNLESENYLSINEFISGRWGDIESEDFISALNDLISLSGKSLHEILIATNYEIINHVRGSKLLEFIVYKLSNNEQYLLVKNCAQILINSSLASNDLAMVNFIQTKLTEDEILTILREKNYFMVKSNVWFNCCSKLGALLQLAPNIISETLDNIGSEFLFYQFVHPSAIQTMEKILIIANRSFDAYTNNDKFFEAFEASCFIEYETTAYLLEKCPSQHKDMISFNGFRSVHNCIEEYHPSILELLLESQYELIDNYCDIVLISRIIQVIKFFDCEKKPDLSFMVPYVEIPTTKDEVIELIIKCFKYKLFQIAKFLCSHIETNRNNIYYLVGECLLNTSHYNQSCLDFLKYALSLLSFLEKERLLNNELIQSLPAYVRENIA